MPKNIAGEEYRNSVGDNNFHEAANSYVTDVTAQNVQQARQNSRPGRQHMDLNYPDNIGRRPEPKPSTPDYSARHYDDMAQYERVRRDRWNNEYPEIDANHTGNT